MEVTAARVAAQLLRRKDSLERAATTIRDWSARTEVMRMRRMTMGGAGPAALAVPEPPAAVPGAIMDAFAFCTVSLTPRTSLKADSLAGLLTPANSQKAPTDTLLLSPKGSLMSPTELLAPTKSSPLGMTPLMLA